MILILKEIIEKIEKERDLHSEDSPGGTVGLNIAIEILKKYEDKKCQEYLFRSYLPRRLALSLAIKFKSCYNLMAQSETAGIHRV